VDTLEPSNEVDRGARRMLRQTRFLAAMFRAYERRVEASGCLDEHGLRARAVAVMRGEERSRADYRQPAKTAAEILDRAAAREDVTIVLDGECLFEMPVSHHAKVDGSPVLVRALMDCLRRWPDGRLTVVVFKTGAQAPEHRRQIDLFVEATRALFLRHQVDGRLNYLS